MSHTRPIVLCLALLGMLHPPARGSDSSGSMDPSTGAPNTDTQRGLHTFDFDERGSGNVEDEPKHWQPLRTSHFPRFAKGVFDFEVGHAAPPSFRLRSEGRNIAYVYNGPATRVRVNTAYRVQGFIRPSELNHARACLSAHYLDKFGKILPDTWTRTRFVGSADSANEWIPVELRLPPAPSDAHTIGLIAWVLQQSQWDASFVPGDDPAAHDVHATAWFDDITIHTAPRIELSTSPGNVLEPGESREIRVLYVDTIPTAPAGLFRVYDAENKLVQERSISVRTNDRAEPMRVPLGNLPPGWYHAHLELGSGDAALTQSLTFAVLPSPALRGRDGGRAFGVVVNPDARSDEASELALLEHELARTVKIPLVLGASPGDDGPRDRRTADRLLHELGRRGLGLTAVLVPGGDTSEPDRAGPDATDFFAQDPAKWEAPLAAALAPVAGIFRDWQFGRDDAPPSQIAAYTSFVPKVRGVIRRFLTAPSLGVVLGSATDVAERVPVEQVTLTLGNELIPSAVDAPIRALRELGFPRVNVHIAPLPAEQFDRLARLADWAQRIIHARHAGADTVFVPQTWRIRQTEQGAITEPLEEYIIFRTLVSELGDAVPGPLLPLPDGVTGLVFRDGDACTIALWDSRATPQGRPHQLQLGQAASMVDLWGREVPFERDEFGRQIANLSPLPVFVRGVEPWLVELMTATFSIEPTHVESGSEIVRHTLKIAYQGTRPLSGAVTFDTPSTWRPEPRSLNINLQPGQAQTRELTVRYPHNEPAGERTITVGVRLVESGYYLEVPLDVTIGLTDANVWGTAVLDGDTLLLRHVVTNRGPTPLSFRSTANVPERERQYRPLPGLSPGETQTVEYRFSHGRELAGKTVRLTLTELNDGPRRHTLELVVP